MSLVFKRCLSFLVVIIFSILSCSQAYALEKDRFALVLDVSNSMWGRIDEREKILLLREVIGGLLHDWPQEYELGAIAYGHRRKSCDDIETVIPVGTVDSKTFISTVNGLVPRGRTPLTSSILHAAEELDYKNKPATIVVLSDGAESCNLDPCALTKKMEADNPTFTAHVVGFGMNAEDAKRNLSCIAQNTGGQFFTADNQGELYKVAQSLYAATVGEAANAEELQKGFEKALQELKQNFEIAVEKVDLEKADRHLRAMWQLVADLPEYQEEYETYLNRLDDLKEVERQKKETQNLINDAHAAVKDKRYQDAYRLYHIALERNPQNKEATRGLEQLDIELKAALKKSLELELILEAEQQLKLFLVLHEELNLNPEIAHKFNSDLQTLKKAKAKRERLIGLLQNARRFEQAGQLIKAFEVYKEVIGLDEENKEAKVAIARIVKSYSEKLEESIAAGNLEEAGELLKTYKTISENIPEEQPRLKRYQEKLSELKIAVAQQEKIEDLLGQANSLKEKGEILKAYELYREALSLDKENLNANTALQKLVKQQVEGLKNALTKGNLEEVALMLETYKRIVEELPESQANIAQFESQLTKLKEAKILQEKLDDLFTQAKAMEEQGEMLKAYEVYREILILQSENVDAKTASQRIVEQQKEKLAEALSKGELEEAAILLETYKRIVEELPESQTNIEQFESQLEKLKEGFSLQEQIEDLLFQAQQAEEDGYQLKALKAYTEILSLDNTNAQASIGQQKIIGTQENEIKRKPYEPEMVLIEGGCFLMGSPLKEVGRSEDETLHEVCVEDFYMSKFETKFSEYLPFADDEGIGVVSWGRDASRKNYPAHDVSYSHAEAYTNWLTRKTSSNYRLPTEAEWEYAARGGTNSSRYWGDDFNSESCQYENFSEYVGCEDRFERLAPVGEFKANNFGLYDMLGNLREWTCSKYEQVYSGEELKCSPGKRTSRGGTYSSGWGGDSSKLRSAARSKGINKDIGIRLVRDIPVDYLNELGGIVSALQKAEEFYMNGDWREASKIYTLLNEEYPDDKLPTDALKAIAEKEQTFRQAAYVTREKCFNVFKRVNNGENVRKELDEILDFLGENTSQLTNVAYESQWYFFNALYTCSSLLNNVSDFDYFEHADLIDQYHKAYKVLKRTKSDWKGMRYYDYHQLKDHPQKVFKPMMDRLIGKGELDKAKSVFKAWRTCPILIVLKEEYEKKLGLLQE